MKSRKIKWLIWTGAVLALLFLIATVLISAWVPRYLASNLIPSLAHKYGLDARQVEIKRIGWFGAEVGPIQIDGAGKPVVRFAAVHIDYSPFSLVKGTLNGIVLKNARVVIAITPEGLSIPGLKMSPKAASGKDPISVPDLDGLLPVGIKQIQIRQSEVVLLWKERPLAISIDMVLACDKLNKGRLTGKAGLSFLGNKIALAAHLDQGANKATFKLGGDRLLLGPLAEFADLPPGMVISANAKFKGQAGFELTPLKLMGLNFSGQLMETSIALPSAAVENLPLPDGDFKPISIGLEATGPTAINWNCGPFLINGPLKTNVLELSGKWAPGKPGWVLDAVAKMVVATQTTDTGISLPAPLPLTWQFQARPAMAGGLEFDARTANQAPLALEIMPLKISCPTYIMETHGRLADKTLSADTTLSANQILLKLPGGEVKVADIKVANTLSLQPQGVQTPSEITTHVILSELRSKYGPAQSLVPRLDINATGRRLSGQPWRHQADLKMSKANILDTSHGIKLSGIQIDMPLHWPPEPSPKAGTLNILNIQWKHHEMGNLKGRLQQQNRAVEIALRHKSKLFSKLNVLINGRLDANSSAVKVNLPTYRFAEAIDLGRFFPNAAGVLADGQIEAKAILNMNKGVFTGSAAIKTDHGSLKDELREISLDGIQANIQIDDLMALKSMPKQKLHVADLTFGKIVANDLDVEFQLENSQTLLIEKANFGWCQGRIKTSALRITPGKKTYDATLFCHRLNLAMVLEQLSAGQASGEGTVNGAIPLRWHNGVLTFAKGFLHSPPGKPGTIKLAGTEAVLAGLPPGTPQHTQIDIATEALKDYTYKWVKLNMESQNENLLLKLQFDGKPNRLLPFAFDKQLGRLKRVSGEGQAEFKGVGIDLNFSIPLNTMLYYKKLLTPNQ